MKQGAQISEGKAKILYETEDKSLILQYFKDDATAFDGKKKGSIKDKGILNNSISSLIFQLLEKEGIKTHFVEKVSDREMLIKRVDIIPIEVVVRNITAGSLAKRMGVEEGRVMTETIIELYYKDDALGDPMINDYHVRAFGLGTQKEIDICREKALKVNKIMTALFDDVGLTLVDYKLEFGRIGSEIILADEISPDNCRLWDKVSGEKMDKDRFRRGLGNIEEAYQEVLKRLSEKGIK
ncbi:MAG: phosphoribosylaminoimidazolesuccinocarboxamide synthase [Nitrospinota bacterium]|nr:phosphoribosylaminoimidazolesuccinocarboxamide synthase [Nitrospinota bacterium]